MKIFPYLSFFVFLTFLCESFSHAQSGIVTTYVGPQLPVSGLPATSLHIDLPNAVVADGTGGFYVASSHTNRVYRVRADGILLHVAGIGTYGFSGDGGPATSAQIALPSALAIDRFGNLYIAEWGNGIIRKVTPAGVISTAGRIATTSVPLGLAVDFGGNVYVAESGFNRVIKLSPEGASKVVAGTGVGGFSGDGGPATSAQLSGPKAVIVDAAGNLYIADSGNNRIREVSADGRINTLVVVETPPFSDTIHALALDGSGNLYFAIRTVVNKLTALGIVRAVAGSEDAAVSFADGVPATSTRLGNPVSIAADSAGNLYIADLFYQKVRKVTADGIINTVAGNPDVTGISGLLKGPRGLVLDAAGNLYFAEVGANQVRRVTPDGVISSVAGNGTGGFMGDGGPATAAQLSGPAGVALDDAGNLYIADTGNHRIRRVTPDGIINTVAGDGTAGTGGDGGPPTSAQLYYPWTVEIDPAGNLYIAEPYKRKVRMVSRDGAIYTLLDVTPYSPSHTGPLNPGPDSGPFSVVVDPTGNLYIPYVLKIIVISGIRVSGDSVLINRLLVSDVTLVKGFGVPLDRMAMDTMGNLYTVGARSVFKLTPDGVITRLAGDGRLGFTGDGGPATSANFSELADIAVDKAGNIYLADFDNGRIRKITFPLSRRRP
ncbi:MAG TPA: hypothetical protein VGL91_05470 [Acidobacteriota bacterium]|jgi:sugar lactone lactonase YvrE